MGLVQKKRHKPFYKQFLRLRKNIQNRSKLFKFKKQKWKQLQNFSSRQLSFFRRFRMRDQYGLTISRFASRGNSFQRKFRNNLQDRKTFNLFFGGLTKKYLKRRIKTIKSKPLTGFQTFRHEVLRVFETRLDIVLYRAKFSSSIKSARQLIRHGHVLVNGNIVRTKSYLLKADDLIKIALNMKSRILVKNNIDRSNLWPIPPKHLLINYRTLQIIFVYKESSSFLPLFDHYLNVDSVISNINKF